MSVGPWQLILIVLAILLLFGGGRVSGLMGDVAKGIKSFKKGLADDEEEAKPTPKQAQRLEQRGEAAETKASTRDEQKLDG